MNQFELLEHALSICEKRGAEASAKLRHGNEWSTNISNGAIELHEAASSQGIGITCYLKDGRNASVSTNDLQLSTIERLANEAVDLAEAGAPDEWKALAAADQCGQSSVDNLDDGGGDFNEEQAVQLILDAERIAKANLINALLPATVAVFRCSAVNRGMQPVKAYAKKKSAPRIRLN